MGGRDGLVADRPAGKSAVCAGWAGRGPSKEEGVAVERCGCNQKCEQPVATRKVWGSGGLGAVR